MAAAAVENRRSNRSSGLTEEEEKAVAGRIYGVIANLDELRFMLTTAVARCDRGGWNKLPLGYHEGLGAVRVVILQALCPITTHR